MVLDNIALFGVKKLRQGVKSVAQEARDTGEQATSTSKDSGKHSRSLKEINEHKIAKVAKSSVENTLDAPRKGAALCAEIKHPMLTLAHESIQDMTGVVKNAAKSQDVQAQEPER